MQPPVSSAHRKKVKFDVAAEFLAACASGDTEEAKAMLEEAKQNKRRNGKGAAEVINCSNADGITALHQVRRVLSPRFDRLVQFRAVSRFFLVSLTQACIDCSIEIVTFLLEHGASVNQVDSEGWTPLHVAASCGHADITE